jgi:hypothetical protein
MLVNIIKVFDTCRYVYPKMRYTGQTAVIDNTFVVSRYTSRAGNMTFVTEGLITFAMAQKVKKGDRIFFDKEHNTFTNVSGTIFVGEVKRIIDNKHRSGKIQTVVVHFGLQETGQDLSVAKKLKTGKKSEEKDV